MSIRRSQGQTPPLEDVLAGQPLIAEAGREHVSASGLLGIDLRLLGLYQ